MVIFAVSAIKDFLVHNCPIYLITGTLSVGCSLPLLMIRRGWWVWFGMADPVLVPELVSVIIKP